MSKNDRNQEQLFMIVILSILLLIFFYPLKVSKNTNIENREIVSENYERFCKDPTSIQICRSPLGNALRCFKCIDNINKEKICYVWDYDFKDFAEIDCDEIKYWRDFK